MRTFDVHLVRIAPVRLAHQNPRLRGAELRPLRSREAHVRPVRIASRRLADENPLLVGRNLMRRVLHGTRRKERSVHGCSRAVRTFGVHLVRIAPVRLAHQNPRLRGAESDAIRESRVLSGRSRIVRGPCFGERNLVC